MNALGIAQSAQSTADQNTAAIQVTKDSISALVEGIHFDSKGNITNIDTSGLVTTDDFNVLLSKKVNFDAEGHITNISTSGLVTEAGFAQMFSNRAEADGYVKRAEISTFITEDDAGRLISNATISADQIRFNGNIVANDTFVVDTEGNLTLNNIIANGFINATSGYIGGLRINENSIGLPDESYPLDVHGMNLSMESLTFVYGETLNVGNTIYRLLSNTSLGAGYININVNDVPSVTSTIANLIAGKYGLKVSSTGVFKTADGGVTWNSI